ncbi:hypothetical protein KIPB_012603, partial [Kipferlia bialata]
PMLSLVTVPMLSLVCPLSVLPTLPFLPKVVSLIQSIPCSMTIPLPECLNIDYWVPYTPIHLTAPTWLPMTIAPADLSLCNIALWVPIAVACVVVVVCVVNYDPVPPMVYAAYAAYVLYVTQGQAGACDDTPPLSLSLSLYTLILSSHL